MARSTYVYVASQDGEVIGTWTVKHEAQSTLVRMDKDHHGVTVRRHKDGTLSTGDDEQTAYNFCHSGGRAL